MIRKAALMRMTDKITTYIQQYVTLAGVEKREEVLELFDNMNLLFPNWVIMTCPVMHPDIHYIGKNFSDVFGSTKEYLFRNVHTDSYFNQVHEADQEDLHECFAFLHNHLETTAPDDHQVYRGIFHYRFRKEDGQYMYLHDEKAALHLRGSGNLYYALFRDITAEKTFNGVKIELFRKEPPLKKIGEFKPAAQRNQLSKRETELVTLFRQGMSTKEIAWYLKISQHTVRNIKSRLFEKFNVNNTIELLNMTR